MNLEFPGLFSGPWEKPVHVPVDPGDRPQTRTKAALSTRADCQLLLHSGNDEDSRSQSSGSLIPTWHLGWFYPRNPALVEGLVGEFEPACFRSQTEDYTVGQQETNLLNGLD